jgi:hypothetical protein
LRIDTFFVFGRENNFQDYRRLLITKNIVKKINIEYFNLFFLRVCNVLKQSKKMQDAKTLVFFRQKSAGRRQIQFIGALQMLDEKTLVFFRPANAGRRQIQFIGALQMLDKKTLVFFRPANAGRR